MATKPKFVPSDFVAGAVEEFGWNERIGWREPTDLREAMWLVRAQEQHALVRRLHTLFGPDASVRLGKAFDGVSSGFSTWRRKFTGAVPATEDDLILWAWIVYDAEHALYRDELRWQKSEDAKWLRSGERRTKPLKPPVAPVVSRVSQPSLAELADHPTPLPAVAVVAPEERRRFEKMTTAPPPPPSQRELARRKVAARRTARAARAERVAARKAAVRSRTRRPQL